MKSFFPRFYFFYPFRFRRLSGERIIVSILNRVNGSISLLTVSLYNDVIIALCLGPHSTYIYISILYNIIGAGI